MMRFFLLLVLACGSDETRASDQAPEDPVIAAIATPPEPAVVVAQQIEAAADPMVRQELDTLRQTVERLHGQEAVQAIMREVDEAKREAAQTIVAEQAVASSEKVEAVQKAADAAKSEPEPIQTDSGAK